MDQPSSETSVASNRSSFFTNVEPLSFYFFFACATFATLWIIWAHDFPAMVDLPGFSAGLQALHEIMFLENSKLNQIYKIDFLQPYLIPSLTGALLVDLFDAVTSAKILLSFATIAGPAACCYLASRAGADRWWSLLVFATFFGYAYAWGMVSQLVAVPFAFLFLAFCLEVDQKPTAQSVENIFSCGLLLIFSHGLVALFTIGTGGILLAIRRPRSLSACLPLLSIVLLTFVESCLLLQSVSGLKVSYAPGFQWSVWSHRMAGFLSSVFSIESDITGAMVCVLFFAVALHANRCMYVAPWNRRTVFALFIVCILSAPNSFDYKVILYRGSCLVTAIAILGFAAPVSRSRTIMLRCAIVAVVFWQIQRNCHHSIAMDKGMAPFQALLSRMTPSQSAMSICSNCNLPGVVAPVLFHISGWYGAVGSGVPAYYFPNTSPWPIRYRDEFKDIAFRQWTGSHPSGAPFDFAKFPNVKYFIFHGNSWDRRVIKKSAVGLANLVDEIDDWALFENVDPIASPFRF